jgi:hypothetical protein
MSAALVDKRRPVAGRAVQLGAVRLAPLGQLVRPVAHALQPFVWLQLLGVLSQAVEDVVDAVRAAQIGGKPREPEIDDVSVSVVETREHRRAGEVDNHGLRALEAHDFAAPARDDLATCDGEVALGVEAGASQRSDPPTRQDQIRSQLER